MRSAVRSNCERGASVSRRMRITMARIPNPDITSMNESTPKPNSVSASSCAPKYTEISPSAKL
jgi:hypothetical protein